MRAVIQRVSEASVSINNKQSACIRQGFLVFLGIEEADNEEDITWLCQKIIALRVFSDNQGQMNLSIQDVQGDILLVSQFTLHASTKKGNRPSFIKAAKAPQANALYEKTVLFLQSILNKPIYTGSFGADMQVALINNGPVTIIIDSKNKE